MSFLDDPGSATDTQEPADPEADARAAALTPDRAAYLAMEIDGLSTQLVARAIEMGMTPHGFLLTMAHQWHTQGRKFQNSRAAGAQLATALAEKNRQQEAAPAAAAPPSGDQPAGGAGPPVGTCLVEDLKPGDTLGAPFDGEVEKVRPGELVEVDVRRSNGERRTMSIRAGVRVPLLKVGPFTMTNTGVSPGCGVFGCAESKAHTHLPSGRVVVVVVSGNDCPLIDCNIAGPHDHGDGTADAAPPKQEP